jgi:hypothetical protein
LPGQKTVGENQNALGPHKDGKGDGKRLGKINRKEAQDEINSFQEG